MSTTTETNDTVIIDSTSNFAASTGYYVEIASGVFEDAANNDYAAIRDKTTWNFETSKSNFPWVLFIPALSNPRL